jgi:signal transduction histidine kinase
MEKMLGTLLEFSKPVQLTSTNFMLADLLTRVIESNAHQAFEKNIDVILSNNCGDTTFHGDYELLTQAFANLLQNSIDACNSTQKGSVILNINRTKNDSHMFEISCIDNGRGMSPSTLNRIFEPFFTTRSEGIGLGLPNVKKVVELHRGTVKITSTVGVGTTVTILLSDGGYLV